jgi:hypothetical protein
MSGGKVKRRRRKLKVIGEARDGYDPKKDSDKWWSSNGEGSKGTSGWQGGKYGAGAGKGPGGKSYATSAKSQKDSTPTSGTPSKGKGTPGKGAPDKNAPVQKKP